MILKMIVIMGLQSLCPYLHFLLSHDVEDDSDHGSAELVFLTPLPAEP